MATVSGACIIAKVSGLLQIREDTAPSKLIWKAIDQDKSLEVPLNNLSKLQASPDTSPKMLLRLFYIQSDVGEIKDIKLTFNNRQTMNSVKETLQTIVARQKTIIKDTPSASKEASASGTPAALTPDSSNQEAKKTDPLDFSSPQSLSDASLLKNRQLQQKLLLEDKALRNVFTQSVINYKLSPSIFWSTRVSQLRTFALGTCQHRGPYNVLSTIKPVATSDNQVNVNVTRDTIQEIFDTYPIIRRACNELVPDKLNEGEFWSRFFNSKLFRRLRGDKINNSSVRGDIVIDKYLYVDADSAAQEKEKSRTLPQQQRVSKFIDLYGNEVDNSQKLGISPDYTMKFSNDEKGKDLSEVDGDGENVSHQRENEMLILMKNMNKLSSKMIGYNNESAETHEEPIEEMERELQLDDLNEASDIQYIELNLDSSIGKHLLQEDTNLVEASLVVYDKEVLQSFIKSSTTNISAGTFDLKDTFETKSDEISKAAQDITGLVKHNFRVYKLIHNVKEMSAITGQDLLPEEKVQELITFNMTLIEFLLHFWNLLLGSGNPVQLKKIFLALKNSQSVLATLEKDITELIKANPQAKANERLSEKLFKDLETCLFPLKTSLSKALQDYVDAVRASNNESPEINENGKRPHEGPHEEV